VGQFLDVAMLDATVQVLTFQGTAHLTAGRDPQRLGNRHPSIAPYETFLAQDGHFNLAVGNDAQFKKLCELLVLPQLAEDPRFGTNPKRVEHRPALAEVLQARFAEKPVAAWLEALGQAGIPAGPISDLRGALGHPQLAARGMIAEVAHAEAGTVRMLGNPLPLEGTSNADHTPPPALGEHTREVLERALELPPAEVDRLAREQVIALSRRAAGNP
jgi:crotonobetainyl-CoA:carnitine CoA-transferase CaiB-like acyl-CoA transferase